jgi:hypothetical protein
VRIWAMMLRYGILLPLVPELWPRPDVREYIPEATVPADVPSYRRWILLSLLRKALELSLPRKALELRRVLELSLPRKVLELRKMILLSLPRKVLELRKMIEQSLLRKDTSHRQDIALIPNLRVRSRANDPAGADPRRARLWRQLDRRRIVACEVSVLLTTTVHRRHKRS